jgi:type I restriction enzyme S subunit
MRDRIGELVARATGGAQVHINKDIINAFEVLLPNARLSAFFKEHTESVFRQVAVLMFQNDKLHASRDLLLPRLMSGEIAV